MLSQAAGQSVPRLDLKTEATLKNGIVAKDRLRCASALCWTKVGLGEYASEIA